MRDGGEQTSRRSEIIGTGDQQRVRRRDDEPAEPSTANNRDGIRDVLTHDAPFAELEHIAAQHVHESWP